MSIYSCDNYEHGKSVVIFRIGHFPVSILRKSDGPMTARCRFTWNASWVLRWLQLLVKNEKFCRQKVCICWNAIVFWSATQCSYIKQFPVILCMKCQLYILPKKEQWLLLQYLSPCVWLEWNKNPNKGMSSETDFGLYLFIATTLRLAATMYL